MPAINLQAALEEAVAAGIRAASLGYGLTISSGVPYLCKRMFDGRPDSLAPVVFLAVHDEARTSDSRTVLDERFSVAVTISVQLPGKARDRWVERRDLLHTRMDAIRALIHKDSYNWPIINAANVLADRSHTDDTKRVGFCEALQFVRLEKSRTVRGDWYASDSTEECGVVQTAVFGRARLIQAIATAG